MTCRDCLHYDMCDCINIALPCADFQDKSEWVHLPCKAGDTAYIVKTSQYKEPYEWYMEKITIGVVAVEHGTTGDDACYIEDDYGFSGGYLGATAFLTKEEAEKALEERRTTHYDA